MSRRPLPAWRLVAVAMAAALLSVHLSCSPGPTVPLAGYQSPTPGGWQLVEPKPVDCDLSAVYAADHHCVWAVGQHGAIVRFDGWNSQRVYSGTTAGLVGIHGTGPSDIYAVGWGGDDPGPASGVVLHFDGASWSTVFQSETLVPTSVWCRAPNDVFVVGYRVVLHYDGHAWTQPIECPYELHAVSGAGRWVCAPGRGGILMYDGLSWSFNDLGSDVILLSAIANGPVLWAGGDRGSDGVLFEFLPWHQPTSWRLVGTYPNSGPVLSLTPGPTNRAVATTGDRIYLVDSPGDSLVWSGVVRKVRSIASDGSGAEHLLFAVGSFGTLMLGRGDAIAPLESYSTGSGVRADALFGVAPDRLYATTEAPGVLLRASGDDWIPIATGDDERLLSVWADSSGDVCAVGANGTCVLGDAQGNFRNIDTGTTSALTCVWGSGLNDIWATGGYPQILLHYDGANFTPVDIGYQVTGAALAGFGASDVWTLAKGGRVMHWDGSAWSVAYRDSTIDMYELRTALRSGSVFVGGRQYYPERYAVLRFDGRNWVDLHWPDNVYCGGMLAYGADDVYVGTWRATWHYDGTGWVERQGPDGTMGGLWGRPDSGSYCVVDGAIWRHPPE